MFGHNFKLSSFNHPYLIYHFCLVCHLAILLCINTFPCLKINQYWTRLKSVSYSFTQVKTELHEIMYVLTCLYRGYVSFTRMETNVHVGHFSAHNTQAVNIKFECSMKLFGIKHSMDMYHRDKMSRHWNFRLFLDFNMFSVKVCTLQMWLISVS